MNTRRKLCADCHSGMQFGAYLTASRQKKLGWLCLPCGTITEGFGTLDVVVTAAAS